MSQEQMLNTNNSIELGTLQLDEVLGDVLDDMGMDDVLDTLDDNGSDGDDYEDDDDDSQHTATGGTNTGGTGGYEDTNNSNNNDTGGDMGTTGDGDGDGDGDGEHDEKKKENALDAMIDDLDIEDNFDDDDDEEEDNLLSGYKAVKKVILTPEEKEEKQNTQDEACMMLLTPDYFKIENRVQRREMLRQHNPAVKGWPAQELDDTVVLVAESMATGSGVSMQDTQMFDAKESRKRESYMLREVDLSQVKGIPSKYFRGHGNDGSNDDDLAITDDETSDNEIDEFETIDLDDVLDRQRSHSMGGVSSGVANTLKKFGKVGKAGAHSKIVCSGCGLKLKFKAKRRDRDNYVAFHCEKTNKFYVFHDHVCVQLRKIKEAIRTFVFAKEREENPDEPDVESQFINIDVDEHIKPNQRARPRHFTTPKQGDFNYKDDGDEEYSESSGVGKEFLGGVNSTIYDAFSIFGTAEEKEDANDMKHPNFRRYRMQVESIMIRFNRRQKGKSYKDRYGELPPILVFSDLSEFGVSIWEFISDALKSKQRVALWMILRFLALEMPTNSVLDLLKRHTHLLSKHMLREYDEVCKSAMEGSKHPIATALRLSAFMFERARVDLSNSVDYKRVGDQYAVISRKLLKEIESDHLFAMLLQMPSDLGGLSIVEIALKYNLTSFLEDPRIVRVFGVMWFGGYDFLSPTSNFQDAEMKFPDLYLRLVGEPGRFFFSPIGKFYGASVLYLFFLALFSLVTYQKIYYYEVSTETYEYALWGCAFGFVMHEFLELLDEPGEYFGSMTNMWDIFLCVNWIVMFYWRFFLTKDRIFSDNGKLDEPSTRNQPKTEIYMLLWATQCVLLWSRVASLLQTTRSAGPLIRMILNMLSDIANFGLICFVFFIGIAFAVYYIIAGDLDTVNGLGGIGSIIMFTFRTLIGQPEWTDLDSYIDDDGVELFSNLRSNMALGFIVLFSIFGTILLLNLLIAMMASSYESVKDISAMELNKQRIDKTYELDRSRAVIAPPMNLLAYLFYLYWFAFEVIGWVLTFGHRQFNEEYFSPLNRGAGQYREGDYIKFMKAGRKIKALVKKRTTILERLEGNTQLVDRRRGSTVDGSEQEQTNIVWDLQVRHARKTYDLRDSDVLKVKKPFFKRRLRRIPTLDIENVYCRFCRYNLSNENMDIQYYLNLFEQKGQHIDPDDKEFMKSLLAKTDSKYNIPNPKACDLCPNCYRPFKVSAHGARDVLVRRMFILELVSYMAFRISVWPLLIILMFIPANIARIIRFVKRRILLTTDDDEEDEEDVTKSKTVMNRSENNDDYRSTVRKVSKQEEGLNQMVKRIDMNVVRLEKEILGRNEDEYEAADDDEMDEINAFRADEFNKRVDKMRREMHDRFDEMRRLLEESGISGDQ